MPRIPPLNRMLDVELLQLRFCDLDLTLLGSKVLSRAEQVFDVLAERGIGVRPSLWLAEEWYNPDGETGFAIPFYLAHTRLERLERKIMLEAEGVEREEALRILRHETGHAIDEAFQFHLTPEYKRVFGSARRAYPKTYAARADSRDYPINLNAWYGQSHPVEDFAETFAVWMRPRSVWRRQFRDWPVALAKIEAVDGWMRDVRGVAPVIKPEARHSELSTCKRTLMDHYEEKRWFYRNGLVSDFDDDLRKIFPNAPSHRRMRYASAVSVLRANRAKLRRSASHPLGVPAYTVEQVLRQLIHRSRVLNLRQSRPLGPTLSDLCHLITEATIKTIQSIPRLPL